ncbi:MAG: hypothetical protein JSU91_02910, partial [Thermoplasmatales archaeon]
MNKKSNKTTKSKNVKNSNIEDKVDKILLENKEKIKKLKSKGNNFESFSLKNREKNTLFYLKKKPKTKIEESKDNELIKNEEIKEVKTIFEEIPSDNEIKYSEFDKDTNQKKEKIIKQNKTNKEEIFKSKSSTSRLKDLMESKDFDMVVSDIERLIGKESKSKIYEENKNITKKELKADSEKFNPFEKNKFQNISSENQLPDSDEKSYDKLTESEDKPYIFNEFEKDELEDSSNDKIDKRKELKARKKELKDRKKELKAHEKEIRLRQKKLKSLEKKFGSDKKDEDIGKKVEGVDVETKPKKINWLEIKSRKKQIKYWEEELKSDNEDVFGSDLDGEDLEKGDVGVVSGDEDVDVSGDVLVVDDVDDVGVDSEVEDVGVVEESG